MDGPRRRHSGRCHQQGKHHGNGGPQRYSVQTHRKNLLRLPLSAPIGVLPGAPMPTASRRPAHRARRISADRRSREDTPPHCHTAALPRGHAGTRALRRYEGPPTARTHGLCVHTGHPVPLGARPGHHRSSPCAMSGHTSPRSRSERTSRGRGRRTANEYRTASRPEAQAELHRVPRHAGLAIPTRATELGTDPPGFHTTALFPRPDHRRPKAF